MKETGGHGQHKVTYTEQTDQSIQRLVRSP